MNHFQPFRFSCPISGAQPERFWWSQTFLVDSDSYRKACAVGSWKVENRKSYGLQTKGVFFNLSGFLARRPMLNLKGLGSRKPFKSKKACAAGTWKVETEPITVNNIYTACINLSGFLARSPALNLKGFGKLLTFQVEEGMCSWDLKGWQNPIQLRL